jgi:site-specific recombinase XerD
MATIKKLERKYGEAYQLRFRHPVTKRYVRETLRLPRKEAEKVRRSVEAKIALGKYGLETDQDFGYHWLQLQKRYLQYARTNKLENTVKRDMDVFKAFNRYLQNADPPLSEITSMTIEKFKTTRQEMGVKPATIGLELRHLKTVFNQGKKWGMVKNNPVSGVRHPKKGIIQVRYLTKDEVQRLLDVIEQAGHREFRRLILAYLHSGARRGELLAPKLTWEDVDFHKEQILIRCKGERMRFIPMDRKLLSIFQELRQEDHEYPFTFKPDYVSHKIAEYYKLAGINGANLHSLRKTFGSTLLQNDEADLYRVSKLLGHASVKTTERYYVDLLDKNYRASVASLDHLIPD